MLYLSLCRIQQEAERMKVIVEIERSWKALDHACGRNTLWATGMDCIFLLSFFPSYLCSLLSLSPLSFLGLLFLFLFSLFFLFLFSPLVFLYFFTTCLVISLLLFFCSLWESTGLLSLYESIFKRFVF